MPTCHLFGQKFQTRTTPRGDVFQLKRMRSWFSVEQLCSGFDVSKEDLVREAWHRAAASLHWKASADQDFTWLLVKLRSLWGGPFEMGAPLDFCQEKRVFLGKGMAFSPGAVIAYMVVLSNKYTLPLFKTLWRPSLKRGWIPTNISQIHWLLKDFMVLRFFCNPVIFES